MVNLRVLSEKPHRIDQKGLHLAVGRALALEIGIYWVLGWLGLGYRYSTSQPTPVLHHPGYTLPPSTRYQCTTASGTAVYPGRIVSWGSYPSNNSLKGSYSQT